MEEASCSSAWSWEQEKAFENALASYPLEEVEEEGEEKWERIAADVPGKTADDVRLHYEVLLEDIEGIESGRVPLPCYVSSSEGSGDPNDESGGGGGKKGSGSGGGGNGDSGRSGKSSRAEQERRKGIAWTEDEHRLFLLGLEKYGKGDWRSISRNFVISRTPTQVASHAQKYFIRLNSMNKDRRRSSIHDITSVNGGDLASPQGPITGQSNGAVASSAKPGKQQPSGVGVYGTPTIGQPVGGPLVSAVGTPVNLPAPPHMAYGVRAPVAGTIVPGAPMNGTPVPYPMKHSSVKR